MTDFRPLRKDELRPALRRALDQPGGGDAWVDERVEAFEKYASASGLSIERQWGAFEGGQFVTSCLCIASPGQSAMLFLPNHMPPAQRPKIAELIQHVVRDAFARGTHLIQALVAVDAAAEEAIFEQAGFHFLAELIYLQREAGLFFAHAPAMMPVWVPYSPDRHALFAETIAATYEQSLDCPGLTGLRTIEEIIASHRAVGEFNPRHWSVAQADGIPAGVILLARVPSRDVVDVVYMGVVPAFRGRGIGRVLLHHAMRTARDAGCDWVTLAVDAANAPARRLYESCGFSETSRRRAWIAASRARA